MQRNYLALFLVPKQKQKHRKTTGTTEHIHADKGGDGRTGLRRRKSRSRSRRWWRLVTACVCCTNSQANTHQIGGVHSVRCCVTCKCGTTMPSVHTFYRRYWSTYSIQARLPWGCQTYACRSVSALFFPFESVFLFLPFFLAKKKNWSKQLGEVWTQRVFGKYRARIDYMENKELIWKHLR